MKCQILLLLAIIIGLCEATSIFTFLRQNGLTNEPKIDNKEQKTNKVVTEKNEIKLAVAVENKADIKNGPVDTEKKGAKAVVAPVPAVEKKAVVAPAVEKKETKAVVAPVPAAEKKAVVAPAVEKKVEKKEVKKTEEPKLRKKKQEDEGVFAKAGNSTFVPDNSTGLDKNKIDEELTYQTVDAKVHNVKELIIHGKYPHAKDNSPLWRNFDDSKLERPTFVRIYIII